MYTLKSFKSTELIISRSRFINLVYCVKNKLEVEEIIKEINQRYSDATHVCYAYVIGLNAEIKKANDDNEPKGTAGIPILNIIEQNQLSNIIVFVVRYFGGTKLGAGGLVRAYGNCAKSVIENNEIIVLQKYYYYQLTFDLSQTKIINQFLFANQINEFIQQEYLDYGKCIYKFKTPQKIKHNLSIQLELEDYNY